MTLRDLGLGKAELFSTHGPFPAISVMSCVQPPGGRTRDPVQFTSLLSQEKNIGRNLLRELIRYRRATAPNRATSARHLRISGLRFESRMKKSATIDYWDIELRLQAH